MHAMQRVIGLLAVTSAIAGAQDARPPQARPLPSATRVCTMEERVLIMQVVDATGMPIADATVAVRNVRTRARVERVEAMGNGDYRIFDDGGVRSVRRAGDALDVLFSYGTRRRRVRVTIGTDSDGCHVRFITVPAKVVL